MARSARESLWEVIQVLIEQIGFTPIDTGSLRESGRQQPGAAIYAHPLTASEARDVLAGQS